MVRPGGEIGIPACRQAGAQDLILKKCFFVYILQSLKTGEYYKGITNNFERRFKEHILGRVSSTSHKLPLRLIHVEFCRDRVEARSLEKFFKSGFGREIINEIASFLGEWRNR